MSKSPKTSSMPLVKDFENMKKGGEHVDANALQSAS